MSKAITFGVMWVNEFGFCKNKNIKKNRYCDALAMGFEKSMQELKHKSVFSLGDEFAEKNLLSSHTKNGNDNDILNGVDTVNFVFIASHGGLGFKDTKTKSDRFWYYVLFNDKGGCVDCCWWKSTSAEFGDNSLKWAVFDSCQSMQMSRPHQGVIATSEYPIATQYPESVYLEVTPQKIWERCFRGLHMIFGFSGFCSDSWWTDDRGMEFGRRAGSGEKLAESWLEEAYSRFVDDLPVVMACGRTEEESQKRFYNETILSNFPDIPGPIWFTTWYRD